MLGERKIYSIFVYVAACLKYIFNEDFQPYIFASMIPMIVCTVAGLLFVFVWGIVRTMNARARTLHGTARWARKKDLKKNGLLAKEPGIVLAQLNTAKVKADKETDTALRLELKKEAQFITHRGKANTPQAEQEAYEKAPVLAGAFFEVAEDQQDMVETHIVVADSESNQDDEDASYFL